VFQVSSTLGDSTVVRPPRVALQSGAMTTRARDTLWFVLTCLALGCSATPPRVTPTPPPDAAAARPPVTAAPLNTSLPAGAVIVASMDTSKLDALAGQLLHTLPGDLVHGLERELRLPADTLLSGQPGNTLALDPSRPITLSLSGLNAEGNAAVDALAAITARLDHDGAPAAAATELLSALDQLPTVSTSVRVVFPTTNAETTLGLLRRALGWERSQTGTAPPGMDGIYHQRAQPWPWSVGLSHDAGSVVIDVWLESRSGSVEAAHERARRGLIALRSRDASSPTSTAPDLAGAVLRVALSPVPVARLGYLDGLTTMRWAISPVDTPHRAALSGVGGYESHRALVLAGNDRGAWFDALELTADGTAGDLRLALRADLGAGAGDLTPLFARTPSVTPQGGAAVLDLANAWVDGWAIPGEPAVPFARSIAEAGWVGSLVAAPFFLVSSIRDLADHGPLSELNIPGLRQRFERTGVGVNRVARHEQAVAFGLLPASATAQTAGCVLALVPARCSPRAALRPNQIAPVLVGTPPTPRAFARLVPVGTRWVVLVARDRAFLDDASVLPTPTSVGPFRFEIASQMLLDDDNLAPLRGLLAPRYQVGVTLQDRRLTFAAVPAPTP
jgi:hypothetical protein